MTSPLDSALPMPGAPTPHHVDQIIALLTANKARIGDIVIGFTMAKITDQTATIEDHLRDEMDKVHPVILRMKCIGCPVDSNANGPVIESLGRAIGRATTWKGPGWVPIGHITKAPDMMNHPMAVIMAKAAAAAAQREPEAPESITPSEN